MPTPAELEQAMVGRPTPSSSQLAHLSELASSARETISAATAASTEMAYAGDWQRFEAWAASQGLPALPAAPGTLVLYLESLRLQGRKPSTLVRARASIAVEHSRAKVDPNPARSVEVSTWIQGMRRAAAGTPSGKVRRAAPILTSSVRAIATAESITLRDRLLIILGWSGCFRRAELCALNIEDLEFRDGDGVIVNVRKSKTDQLGEGKRVDIQFADDEKACPVRLLRAFVGDRKTGPLFPGRAPTTRTRNGVVETYGTGRLSSAVVAKAVKRAASKLGLDGDYSGHSLRRGFATSASRAGMPLQDIERLGGWSVGSRALRRDYLEGGMFQRRIKLL